MGIAIFATYLVPPSLLFIPLTRVVYFLDIVANYYDHAVAEGVVAVLRHCGVQVYVPKRQRGCGMPAQDQCGDAGGVR